MSLTSPMTGSTTSGYFPGLGTWSGWSARSKVMGSSDHLHRTDLPALLLVVPSRGVRHLPTVDHEAAVDLGELICLVALFLVVVLAFAISRRGPGLMEVAPKHDTFLKGVLDGALVIGARLVGGLRLTKVLKNRI